MSKIKVCPKKLKQILKNKKCNTPFGKYISTSLGYDNHPLNDIPNNEFGSKVLFTYIEFINDEHSNPHTNKPSS